MTGRVKFETITTPRPLLADMVSNPTPPGHISRANKRHRFAQVLASTRNGVKIRSLATFICFLAKFRLDIRVALTNHFPIQNELPNWIYSSAFGDFPIISFSFVAIVPSFPMLRSRRDDYHAWI